MLKAPAPKDESAPYHGCSQGNDLTSQRRVRGVRALARRWFLRHETRPYGAQQARKLRNAGNRDEGTPSVYAMHRLFFSLNRC